MVLILNKAQERVTLSSSPLGFSEISSNSVAKEIVNDENRILEQGSEIFACKRKSGPCCNIHRGVIGQETVACGCSCTRCVTWRQG